MTPSTSAIVILATISDQFPHRCLRPKNPEFQPIVATSPLSPNEIVQAAYEKLTSLKSSEVGQNNFATSRQSTVNRQLNEARRTLSANNRMTRLVNSIPQSTNIKATSERRLTRSVKIQTQLPLH